MILKDCFPEKYIVLDTETSGLDPETDKILEIAVLRVKDKKPESPPETYLLNPNHPLPTFEVPAKITEITGITTSEIALRGMYPRGVLTDVNNILTDSVIFAHNGIRFDRPFINAELGRTGLKQLQPEQFLDSAALFKAWRLDILNWLDDKTFFEFANQVLEKRARGVYFNLKYCCETLAIDISDLKGHRAGADVVMIYRVIEALRKRLLGEDQR